MNVLRIAAAAALVASAAAQAATPGIGHSGNLTWEQVRFYGPSGGANGTYPGGQPTYVGTTATDLCAGADLCGDSLNFNTLIGGKLAVTGTDGNTGTRDLAVQDLSPSHGGLGVIGYKGNKLVGGDEINAGDSLTLSFANRVQIVGFHFWDENHSAVDFGRKDQFGLSIDGGATQYYTLENFPWYGEHSLLTGKTFTFSYKNEDFYLGAIKIAATAPVPEPETLALMLGGLMAVGAVARRRRA